MPTKQIKSILGDTPPPFSAPTRITGVADDFNDFHKQWQAAKTPENNTQILHRVQPVIDTAVASYASSNPSPTIKTRARLMALKALESYDAKRGNVRTHLLSQLQGLRRLSAQEQNIISVPEQVSLDYQHLSAAENELRDKLSRDPTDEEIANETGLSARRIKKIRAFNVPVASGATTRNTDEENYGGDVASQIPTHGAAEEAWLDFVYGDLAPTDQLIMDLTLGRNGRKPTSTQEIARRLNITPGAVSQRAAKIQTLINQRSAHNF